MAKLRELIIKISANSSSYQSELARMSRLSNDYYKNMGASGRRYQQSLRAQQNALADINKQLSTVTMTAKGMAGAMAGFFSVSAIVSTVDEWGQMAARIKMALKSVEGSTNQYENLQNRFLEISNRNGKNIEDTQLMYVTAAKSMQELGFSTAQTIDLVESMSSSFTANATSVNATQSAISAFGKAMIAGKVAGDNWNAIMNATPTILGDIAAELQRTNGGIKVTETAVKKLGADGAISFKLLADSIINAKNANNELANSMDNTVTDGFTRVANSAKKYFGEANSGIGVTRSMSAALATVSDNFDKVADAGLLLIGVGVTRYLSGLTTSAFAATGALINSAKAEVTLAAAQVNTTKTTVMEQKAKVASAAAALAHARSSVVQGAQLEKVALAEAKVTAAQNKLNTAIATGTNRAILDAKSKLEKAKASLAAAKATDAEAAAEKRLNAEKAKLSNDIANNRDARRNLNRTTSVIGAAGRGLKGIVALAGGLPGILMLSAGAWYMYKQNQEEAHRASLEYAKTLDDIAARTKKMSLNESLDEGRKTKDALKAQTEEIEELNRQIIQTKNNIQQMRDNLKNHGSQMSVGIKEENYKQIQKLTIDVAAAEQTLIEKEQERGKTISVLNGLTVQTVKAFHELNTAKNQKLAVMGREIAQESEFNRILSIGNSILSSRQLLTQAPMLAGNRPELNDQQRQMLWSAEQERILAGMKQRDQVEQRAIWEAESTFSNDEHKKQYISDKLKAFDERERMSKSLKSGTSLMKEAERVTERYKDKMADLSVATEVQRIRALQGEKAAALYAAGHETGAKWTDEQRKSIQSASVQLAEWTQKADEAVRKQREMADALKDLRDATRKFQDDTDLAKGSHGMGDRQKDQFEERQQIERVFDKTDKGKDAIIARQRALDALNRKYRESKQAEMDWSAGLTSGFSNWLDEASNYASQVSSVTQSTMSGMVDNISDLLIGNKADWKSWSIDVLKSVNKVLLNMAMVNSMKAAGSYFGGGFGSFISSIIPNAKGGVYDSPSLSSYSGQIVSSPTLFAFAKGAGLMGEAGPEAIMPLTRGSDGSLGVRVLGLENIQNGSTSITSNNAINIDVGDINLISDGTKEQQQPVGDVSGARQQLKNEIVNTVNEQASREGTPLWLLINRRR
ncbi:phage tail tape measure protein [Providencia stuartii]|uniref:phage tail tape measure protein n=1 Tax=Providencia stuartii TaxID=588 RepID=UPI0028BFD329|nr:phage tail tape measure protein [Providencia stuartii]MDT7048359.1 phage tail tape measure protein [Providencia stuartii]